MNDHCKRLASSVIKSYERYRAGLAELADVQAVVEAAVGATDHSEPALLESMTWLRAELELVRFMWSEKEQRAEVAKCIAQFQSGLPR